MNLKPLSDYRCVMCNGPAGRTEEDVTMRYCEGDCVPNGNNGFENIRVHEGQPTPHMHRKCKLCGYEWLAATYDDGPATSR